MIDRNPDNYDGLVHDVLRDFARVAKEKRILLDALKDLCALYEIENGPRERVIYKNARALINQIEE